jgi:SPP1 gp7 family putative phage head morphogenesis protein
VTEADQQAVDRIEADRKRHEKELAILLMLLTDDARHHAQSAVRLGVDPVAAARNVIIGAGHLDQPGLADALSERMFQAYVSGVRRAFRMAGIDPEASLAPIEQAEIVVRRQYEVDAIRATQDLYRRFVERVTRALQADYYATVNATVRAIREELKAGGMTRINPSALELQATTLVLRAYQDGYGAGWSQPQVAVKVKGFRYVAVIDDRTTAVCRAYNGVQLPADHEWFKTHAPPCHFNCRSTYRPLWNDFEPTTLIPNVEPAAGWGTSAKSPLTPFGLVA